MIRRQSDCPGFNDDFHSGKMLKIEGEIVVELAGKSGALPDRELITQAVSAVIHYIKTDLKVNAIPAEEFSTLLEAVLEGFGYKVKTKVKNGCANADNKGESSKSRIERETEIVNLQEIAEEAGSGYELFFFERLRHIVYKNLKRRPKLLYIHGLRSCVKQLVGARKWSPQCQRLSEDIVYFVRNQFQSADHKDVNECTLLIK